MPSGQHDDALARFRAQDLDAAMTDAARKQDVVTPMFDVIAPRYDAFTRIFSFGMDAGWKRELVAAVLRQAPGATRALDLACGTGDIGFALADQLPVLRMTGVDPSQAMLELARARVPALQRVRVTFERGEMASLPMRTASVDIVTAGYGFRNVPDVDAAIAECARVLRPGGVLGSLDFFVPRNAMWRSLFLGYLRVAGDTVGWLWHRTPAIYGYIARSIATFMPADDFSRALARHGFRLIEQRPHLLGGIAMHIAVREATS